VRTDDDSPEAGRAAPSVFDGIPVQLPEELVTTLHRAAGLRIERIVSLGHASPEASWYDQAEHEWVVVLEGDAAIELEGQSELVRLGRGCYLNIPARTRHRVAWTDPGRPTVWLAIHYGG
jgi:cupin 2 domain-containing protein